MYTSIYRLEYNMKNYINLHYDGGDIKPFITKEDFKSEYKSLCIVDIPFEINTDCSTKLYSYFLNIGVMLKIGDIIEYNKQYYYYSNPLTECDIF